MTDVRTISERGRLRSLEQTKERIERELATIREQRPQDADPDIQLYFDGKENSLNTILRHVEARITELEPQTND